MGQDDILAKNALRETYEIFTRNKKIGAVARPYFWFDSQVNVPVRAKHRISSTKNTILRIDDNIKDIITMFSALDQFSGLAFRTSFMDLPFHEDIFPCHVYPFASIFKNHPIVFLSKHTIAVRISSSQTRKLKTIYDKSPVRAWVEMFNNVYKEKRVEKFKKEMIDRFVAKNYVGLVQIKNYGRYKYVLREIWYLIYYRPLNLLSPMFWLFALGTIIIPPFILIKMTDWYKRIFYANYLKISEDINFEYDLNYVRQNNK